jgi:hypothetical protein
MAADRYLEPQELRATRAAGSVKLRVQINEEFCVIAAQFKRVFPLSKPDEFISLQDGAGKEVGILKSVAGLDSTSASLITEELDRRYFTPMIEAIEHLKQEAGMWHFVVRTQRGPTEFYVRNWRDSGFEISPNRWQIHSVDGGRFDIPNLEALDARSRGLMLQLL